MRRLLPPSKTLVEKVQEVLAWKKEEQDEPRRPSEGFG
jgi:hypothetical protein